MNTLSVARVLTQVPLYKVPVDYGFLLHPGVLVWFMKLFGGEEKEEEEEDRQSL